MERKNLCAQIPITLHQRVAQGKEASDCQTLGDYITEVLTAYYDYIEHKGESRMNGTKTLAFQISEELFQRIKDHLSYESSRTGKKLTQRDFVLGLIEQALAEAEAARNTATPPSGEDIPAAGEQEQKTE